MNALYAEFEVSDKRFLLEGLFFPNVWPKVVDKVQRKLLRHVKNLQHIESEAKVRVSVDMCAYTLVCVLTINPRGIPIATCRTPACGLYDRGSYCEPVAVCF